jgi:hypothetical protein
MDETEPGMAQTRVTRRLSDGGHDPEISCTGGAVDLSCRHHVLGCDAE